MTTTAAIAVFAALAYATYVIYGRCHRGHDSRHRIATERSRRVEIDEAITEAVALLERREAEVTVPEVSAVGEYYWSRYGRTWRSPISRTPGGGRL